MVIGIDARLYGLKNRGIGRYLENLIKNLEKIDHQNQYFVFLYKNNFFEYQPENINFKKVLINIRWYTIKEQIFIPFIIKKYKIDLMHFPHFNATIWGIKNFIVTLHDLTLLHYPNRRVSTLPTFFYKIKYFFFKKIQKNILTKAKYIIVPSNFVKDDLINFYPHLTKEKIVVISEGINQSELSINTDILEKFKITKPFLLFVGAAYPHKNLERMIKAFSIINKNKKYQLVIVGLIDFFMKRLKNWTVNNFSNKDIIFTDFLSDQDLTRLYRSAEIFVFPSLSEGFGLPGLEAQINNLPIASSDQTCLKEILGKGALYFNPFDLTDMTEKINELIINKNLQIKVKKAGENNVNKYHWLDTAKKTLELYY